MSAVLNERSAILTDAHAWGEPLRDEFTILHSVPSIKLENIREFIVVIDDLQDESWVILDSVDFALGSLSEKLTVLQVSEIADLHPSVHLLRPVSSACL